ncbi:phosphate acetyltransferase [Gallaecimonas mangrovi]|uniref:phosphate acetyltransferase n=1 Tax=Gallaecimonas mangrovi TaxID=2291597 RepID=UPI000E1FF22B|nr:phosphate acetyltransferase [Gallaecimonas mangrovi]
MSETLLLVPLCKRVAMTSISLGLIHGIQRRGISVNVTKLIDRVQQNPGRGLRILSRVADSAQAFVVDEETLIPEQLTALAPHKDHVSLVVGLPATATAPHPYNIKLAQQGGAKLILLADSHADLQQLETAIGQLPGASIKGVVINQKPLTQSAPGADVLWATNANPTKSRETLKLTVPTLATLPWSNRALAPRTCDLAHHLGALPLNSGDWQQRRISAITVAEQSIVDEIAHLSPGTLVIIPAHRSDLILTACLAAKNGLLLAGLLLTGQHQPEPAIMALCEGAFDDGLPMLFIEAGVSEIKTQLASLSLHLEADDHQRQDWIMHEIAELLPIDDLIAPIDAADYKQSPEAFRYQLAQRAQQQPCRILFPEGENPRIIGAAAEAARRQLAQCLLLGDPHHIRRQAHNLGISLSSQIHIIAPDALRERYVLPMLALRQHKGLEEVMVREQLQDNNALAAMMLVRNEADGIVSGAQSTTLETLRPALQLVRTAPTQSLVSSAFLMLLADHALIYGDCAINPSPNAEQLAQIALQCAASARMLGMAPRLAMIATPHTHAKVVEAIALIRTKAATLAIEGPIAYDMAIIESLARAKAPGTPIAGQANVFVFPDLNTGYSTLQTIQRSAQQQTIGPITQGLAKPVNDLARDASVDDIVQMIILTVLQASY